MKKIINKSKLIFSSIILLALNLNIVKAGKYSEWDKSSREPIEAPMKLEYFVFCELYKLVELLIVLFLLILIFNIVRYFNHLRKNKSQEKNKLKKKIKIILFILFLLILLYGVLAGIFSCSIYVPFY